jgi:hypothetical protein
LALIDDLAGRISLVRVETSLLPTVELDHPFEPGPPSLFLQLLQPKITLEFSGGVLRPVVLAPYGEPTEGGGMVLAGGLVVAAVIGGRLLLKK